MNLYELDQIKYALNRLYVIELSSPKGQPQEVYENALRLLQDEMQSVEKNNSDAKMPQIRSLLKDEVLEALENIKANLTGKDYIHERISSSLKYAEKAITEIKKFKNENEYKKLIKNN